MSTEISKLSLRLLGPFVASLGERPMTQFRSKRIQAPLVYLAVESMAQYPIAHQRDALIELVWPGAPPATGRVSLSTS